MGSHTVYELILVAFLAFILTAGVAKAQPPTPEIPYTFEPIEYDTSAEFPVTIPNLAAPEFINRLGSIAVTVWAIIEEYSFVAYLVIILLAAGLIKWIAGFVYSKNVGGQAIEVSNTIELAGDITGNETLGKLARLNRKRPW